MTEPAPKKPFDRKQLAGPIVFALVALIGLILFFTRDARADEAFVAACMSGDGASQKTCACLDKVANKTLNEQMRGYVTLSMSKPSTFAAKSAKNDLPGLDYKAWTAFSRAGVAECGYGE